MRNLPRFFSYLSDLGFVKSPSPGMKTLLVLTGVTSQLELDEELRASGLSVRRLVWGETFHRMVRWSPGKIGKWDNQVWAELSLRIPMDGSGLFTEDSWPPKHLWILEEPFWLYVMWRLWRHLAIIFISFYTLWFIYIPFASDIYIMLYIPSNPIYFLIQSRMSIYYSNYIHSVVKINMYIYIFIHMYMYIYIYIHIHHPPTQTYISTSYIDT